MNDFGFIVFASLAAFLLTAVFWLRVMRSLFEWVGLGIR